MDFVVLEPDLACSWFSATDSSATVPHTSVVAVRKLMMLPDSTGSGSVLGTSMANF